MSQNTLELPRPHLASTACPAWLHDVGDLPLRRRSGPNVNLVDAKLHAPEALQTQIKAALPLTFTPYASTQPCSARCVFCSENLRPITTERHSSQLRPAADYFDGLRRALNALRDLPMGLSLSGLESTDNAPWFLRLLETLSQHEQQSTQPFTEKILYSNGAGFGKTAERPALLAALSRFNLERVEWSRHSDIQGENDRIMRFRPEIDVADNACFERSVLAVQEAIPVTLVCLLQHGGVDRISRAQDYLHWAARLGVKTVIFREFAQVGNNYKPNNTLFTLQRARVSCESLVKSLFDCSTPFAADFAPVALTEGYYFWNIEFLWRQQIRVVFEASNYQRMHERHASDVVYKLVYHANGNLTADWDPNTRLLLRT